MISGVPMSGRSFVSLIMMASGFVWSIRFSMQALFPLMPLMLTTRDLQLRPLWGISCVDLDDVPVSADDDVDPSELFTLAALSTVCVPTGLLCAIGQLFVGEAKTSSSAILLSTLNEFCVATVCSYEWYSEEFLVLHRGQYQFESASSSSLSYAVVFIHRHDLCSHTLPSSQHRAFSP